MKKSLVLAGLALALLSGCEEPSPANYATNRSKSASSEVQAAASLARRVLGPSAARQITFRLLDPPAAPAGPLPDTFRVEAGGRRLIISGNSAGSMAVGLNHYLRSVCHVSYGWLRDGKLRLPRKLPLPSEPIAKSARVPQRFFLNYCTAGYTMPWWKWEDWEHFIDWMALNGVNLPLAVTGQEAIWYEIWTEMGLSDEEVRSYFTGPAHLPWHRMLNIDHWGGPLPKSWLSGQMDLQKRIVARERELSMRPVLPAFAGHVPAALSKVRPEAKISRLSRWGGFSEDYIPSFLDPLDPLFPQIQKAFIEKQEAIYGTDHVYGIDLFNEMVPPSWEPEYLATVGRNAYEALSAADPEAVWLQMGWLFWYQRGEWTPERVKAYLTASPADRQILLDYYCEMQEVWQRTDAFYGTPFVWCYLGNFGGNTHLNGDLFLSGERFEEALRSCGNLTGVGCTLEALDCNPYAYEFILSKAWNDWSADAFAETLTCRAGVNGHSRPDRESQPERESPSLSQAWRNLFAGVYHSGGIWRRDAVFNFRPSMNLGRGHFDSEPGAEYDNAILLEMINALLASGGNGGACRFDLVNFTRQWLSNIASHVYNGYTAAYRTLCEARDASDSAAVQKAREEMRQLSERFMELLDDTDDLLSYESYFLVGKWIADARSWGATPEEADYFESNARNLITTWGDRGRGLCDYARRSQNGLLSGFYRVRWEMFFASVEKELDADAEYSQDDWKAYFEEVCDFEKAWWEERIGSYRSKPRPGSPVPTVRQLIAKYQ